MFCGNRLLTKWTWSILNSGGLTSFRGVAIEQDGGHYDDLRIGQSLIGISLKKGVMIFEHQKSSLQCPNGKLIRYGSPFPES